MKTRTSKPQEGVKLYEAVVQLLAELQQLPAIEADAALLSDVDLLNKQLKAFRCYYMALTCQGNRQWAEALALYQRAEVRFLPLLLSLFQEFATGDRFLFLQLELHSSIGGQKAEIYRPVQVCWPW